MMEDIEAQFQALVDEQTIVGLALAVIRGSDVVYIKGMGVTGVEDYRLPITPDTLFAIGSISKSIAAVTIMRLVEQRLLDLDRPIIDYIDGFAFADHANGQQVTLRHLLSHSSGLPAAGRYWGRRGQAALRQFVWDDLRDHQFVFAPGRFHIYSNTAISCVGYVAEVVTQTPYPELVQQLIFDPLDMQRSTFDLAKAMTYPAALAHRLGADGRLRVIHHHPDNDMGHASSFCFCSTHDLAQFAAALLTPGKLLSAATLREMQTPAISLHTAGANYPGALMESHFGLGLELGEYRGCRLVGHGGMNQSFNCYLKIFPDQEVAVVLQTNYTADEAEINVLFELFDELLQPTAPLRPPAPPTIAYTAATNLVGEYLNPATGIQTITAENGQLVLNGEYPLICIGEGQFYYTVNALRFPVAFPYPDTVVIRRTPYRRLEREDFEPDYAQWQAYTGTFIDPFTPYPDKSAIPVRLENDQLWINGAAQTALSNSQFVSDAGLHEFLDANTLQVRMGTRFVRGHDSR